MGYSLLLWLLFVAAIIAGLVLLLQASRGRDHRTRKDESRALCILNARFARGKIERDEYEERRKVLAT